MTTDPITAGRYIPIFIEGDNGLDIKGAGDV